MIESQIPDEIPTWANDLIIDLEHSSTMGDCEHERSAYSDSAYMVIDYWKENKDHDTN